MELRNVRQTDFDRSIKFGRDDGLFLKREAIERLSAVTRYTEAELQNLKTVYVNFAQPHQGLKFDNFARLMGYMTNIENHPFMNDIFIYFDKNQDGLVDFEEFVIGLDIVERGTFPEKCRYCFEIYDTYGI